MVSPSKRSGSASTSPTVQPSRSGSSNGSTISGSSTPSRWRMMTARAALSVMPVREVSSLDFCLDKALALLCLFRCQPRNFQGLEVLEPGTLDDRQRPTHRRGVENVALDRDRPAFRLVLHQRRLQHRAALEHRPPGLTNHPIDDRALKQVAAGADHQPAQPGQPAALVQRLQEPLGVGALLADEVDVNAIRARDRSPGIAARQAAAGRAPPQPGRACPGPAAPS